MSRKLGSFEFVPTVKFVQNTCRNKKKSKFCFCLLIMSCFFIHPGGYSHGTHYKLKSGNNKHQNPWNISQKL